MNDLERLAGLVGVEPYYHDIWGNRRNTSPETMRALVGAMGLPAAEDPAAALRTVEEQGWRRMLPPVLVLDEGAALSVTVSAPAGMDDGMLAWTLTEEGGAFHREETGFGALPVAATAALDGIAFEQRTLALPVRLPLGYHSLEVELRPQGLGGSLRGSMRVIVAPERCVTVDEVVPGGMTWGIGLQLYSLKSEGNWGIGDFDDLGRFGEIAGGLGAGLVGLNPLHALFPGDPNHFGPYSPSNRGFLNVLYIDVEAVPDLAESHEAQVMVAASDVREGLKAARESGFVDYALVARLKLPVLHRMHASFRAKHLREGDVSARGQAFRAFQRELGETLHRHAVFDTLHEHFFHQDPSLWEWRNWPEEYRHPANPAVAAFAEKHADRVEFFEYLQWEADRQLSEAAARGRKAGLAVGFYRDLAVAAHPGGSASWANPEALVQDANVGAPPDQFNMKGQNWGLAPLSPIGLREAAYEPFITMVRANMRHAGALRIDHVMALKHLFWIPRDGSDGAYVEYPFEDLLRIIALESRRNRCLVIGEDLGTVPEGFRPAMQKAGILSYRVLYFERTEDGGYLPPSGYPADAMVTVTTHDLPTFKGFWTGQDLGWRRQLDLYPDEAAADKDAWDRGVDRYRLLQALSREGLRPAIYTTDDGSQPYSRELVEAVHRYLATTPGRVVMVQVEDAIGELEQPNLPGTVEQHPNWRRKLGMSLEAMAGDEGVRSLANAINAIRGKR